MRSRARAVFYAMGTGMAVGCGAVAGLFAYLSYRTPWPGTDPTTAAVGSLISGLPGIMLLGLIFTGPSALALVITMAAAMRREPLFGSPWLWGASGALWSAPTALLFLGMFDEDLFEVPSVHTVLLALGFGCGLAARWGYREVAEPGKSARNASTIAR